jgi:hypothetical protein
MSGNLFSITLANTPIPKLIKIKIKDDVVFKKNRNLFISNYLKKLSTNSYLLNTCKSSSPSPTPMYFTGI